MLLRLTDGTTTLTLSGAGAYLGATYFPATQLGAERLTESFPLILEGTEAAIRAAVNAIQVMFARARDRGKTLTPRLFAEFRPGDTGDIFRAEVFDGDAPYAQPPAERYLAGALNTVRVMVSWERAAAWQGPEAELPLASSTQAERTGGVTIYNDDNAGNPNWTAVAGANVKGTRPAPVRLKIINATGGSLGWRTFHVGVNAYSAPSSADLWLLGSEAVGGAAKSWSEGVGHNSLQWLFSLPTALLNQTEGRVFRVIAAFDTISSTANLRASVGSYIGGVYSVTRAGAERIGAREMFDLGEFPIPPGGYDVANAAAGLAVTVRSAVAGSGTLDFVMLMPTDSYRRLEQTGYTLANGAAVVDDGIGGGAYALSGSSRYPIVRAVGEGVRVFPGMDQRLYVLFDEGNSFVAGRQMTVQAWYRPIYDNV